MKDKYKGQNTIQAQVPRLTFSFDHLRGHLVLIVYGSSQT
jgi:hypothetical protein